MLERGETTIGEYLRTLRHNDLDQAIHRLPEEEVEGGHMEEEVHVGQRQGGWNSFECF